MVVHLPLHFTCQDYSFLPLLLDPPRFKDKWSAGDVNKKKSGELAGEKGGENDCAISYLTDGMGY